MAAISKFCLLAFPETPLSIILDLLEVSDRYELSFCSTKTKKLVKDWSQSAVIHNTLHIDFGANSFSIGTSNSEHPWIWRWCVWEFHHTRRIMENEDLPTTRHKLNETTTVQVMKKDDGFAGLTQFIHVTDEREKALVGVLEYLQEVLNQRIYSIKMELAYFDDFETILNAPCLRKTPEINVEYGYLQGMEMSRLIDNYQMVNRFHFNAIVNADFEYEKKISVAYLNVQNAKWFSSRQLLNLNCEDVYVYGAQFIPNGSFNKFFLQWIAGNQKRLLNLIIEFSDKEANALNLEDMLQGIESYALGEKSSNNSFAFCQKEGRDILNNDNVAGSVRIIRLPYSTTIFFNVSSPWVL